METQKNNNLENEPYLRKDSLLKDCLEPLACFPGCDEQCPEPCAALCPPLWNTMPHASITVASGATGGQLSACVPLLRDSWGHQSEPPPLAWVWTATQHYKGVSSEHFSASSPHFQAFPDSLVWHFPAGEPFSPTTPIYWEFWPGLIFTLGHFWGASDGSKLEYHWSGSSQHVQSQAPLHLQMERIEAHYCVLGGASSSVNSLAHF